MRVPRPRPKPTLAADPYYLAARYSLWQCLQQQPGREHEAAEEQAPHGARKADMEHLAVVRNELVPQSPGDPDLAAEAGTLLLRTGQDWLGLHWLDMALKLTPTTRRHTRPWPVTLSRKGMATRRRSTAARRAPAKRLGLRPPASGSLAPGGTSVPCGRQLRVASEVGGQR
jgi:hypothetical protein